jgi:hypothetical protein
MAKNVGIDELHKAMRDALIGGNKIRTAAVPKITCADDVIRDS